MNIQNSYGYILIGLTVRMLVHASTGRTRENAIKNLNTLDRLLKDHKFNVTLAYTACDNFSSMRKSIEDSQEESVLEKDIISNINTQIRALENVLFSEASTRNVYIFPERRFNSEYLLNHPAKLLKDGIFIKLDPIARQDLTSACRCILFGEATASAFHILRATESVLKHYYFHHRKKNRLSNPMWANMLDQLKSKKSKKPPMTLINSLDLIRTAYRNPTQHPQAIYEIDSAQDLFGVCLDVIGKMGAELK